MNNAGKFEIEIGSGALADVYFDCDEAQTPWTIVEALDASRIRAVRWIGDPAFGPRPLSEKLLGCSGLVCTAGSQETAMEARRLGLPILCISDLPAMRLEEFRDAVIALRCTSRLYAFYIGRLERDFAHAREAIRIAVESAAGMDFLWIDDGRHSTNVEGIRERTRLSIQHAAFVVADLTLGNENPKHENPSRAHEIGMAIAYERPIFLSSQEPRRYPYFSIGDMQMSFWASEDELETAARGWIRAHQQTIARRVLNYSLTNAKLPEPEFRFDAGRRFLGPNFAEPSHVER
jgi:hypothetical protein